MMDLQSLSFGELLEQVSAKTPAPGGGAVTASVGALSAALALMVVNYSLGKKDLAGHQAALAGALEQLERARWMLLELAVEDAQAYEGLNEAMRLPKDRPGRAGVVAAKALAAVAPPMAIIATCSELLRLCESLATMTNRQLRSDLVIAAILAEATARASRCNVAVNAPLLGPGEGAAQLARADEMIRHAAERLRTVESACA